MMDQRDRDELNQALAKFERGLELYAAGLRQLMALADKAPAPATPGRRSRRRRRDANANHGRRVGFFPRS